MEEYEFTISNGQVTGVSGLFGTQTEKLWIPHGATFVVGQGVVTETQTGGGVTQVTTFTQDPINSAAYDLASITDTVVTPQTVSHGWTSGYQFTVSGGAVTAVHAVSGFGSHTVSCTLPNPPGTAYAVSGATIVETQVVGDEVDTYTYVQPTGSSLWAVSTATATFVPTGGSTTPLNVSPYVQDEFTLAAGVVTGAQSVGPHGALTTLTMSSSNTFTELAAGLVEEVTTHQGHSAYEVFYNGGSGDLYTEVAHGAGSTVDLVGLQAQLAHLSSLAGSLI